MTFKLKPGINHCTNEQYHGDKSYMSSSNLKLLLKDAAAFKDQILDGNRVELVNPAFDEGTYAHSLILEPETVDEEFAFFPGWRKHGAAWDAFKAGNEDKLILSKPQKARVERWVAAYNEHAPAKSFISGGFPEHTVAMEYMGLKLKARADYINLDKGYIADVKTTSYPVDVDSFKMVINQFNYALSAAMYSALFEEQYGKKFDFYFIVLGKKDIAVEVYKASKATMERGKTQFLQAISKYKKCKKSGLWLEDQGKKEIDFNDYEVLEV